MPNNAQSIAVVRVDVPVIRKDIDPTKRASHSRYGVVNQNDIHSEIGTEVTLGAIYRPLAVNNVQVAAGVSVFFPGEGFGDLYESRSALYSVFLQLTLTY